MADDPKDKKPAEEKGSPSAAALSPAPTVVAGETAKDKDGNAKPAQKVQAEPLSDGTVPTVLNAGDGHRTVAKGKASITNIYRKADIMTTLLTFGGAIVAGALIIGGYWFFTRSQVKPTPSPKIDNIDKAELEKLGAFFEGNSAGKSTEVLTINSSSLFNNRVAMSSDLKVVGGVQVTGGSVLGDLVVDKTSTLGVTNVRGSLTVTGPTTFQSPATLGAGGTVNGNLAVSGNGSFGGSIGAGTLNVRDATVSGTLNINGHLNIGGQQPTATAGVAAGSNSNANVSGNDTGGTVTVITGNAPVSGLGGSLVTVNFRQAFPTAPVVVISPNSRHAAVAMPFVTRTATSFTIGIANDAVDGTSYSFSYWVVQ